MKIRSKKYTVGDIAKFYNVSTDTVRLYEKKELLVPQVKSQKGYRIYTRSDVISFDYILKLRNLGIPLNDINELVNNYSLEEAIDYCNQRMLKLEDDIQILTKQKRNLEEMCRRTDFNSDIVYIFLQINRPPTHFF